MVTRTVHVSNRIEQVPGLVIEVLLVANVRSRCVDLTEIMDNRGRIVEELRLVHAEGAQHLPIIGR